MGRSGGSVSARLAELSHGAAMTQHRAALLLTEEPKGNTRNPGVLH